MFAFTHRVTLSYLCQCGQNLIKFITRYLLHLAILESNFFKKKQLKIQTGGGGLQTKGFTLLVAIFAILPPAQAFVFEVFIISFLKHSDNDS